MRVVGHDRMSSSGAKWDDKAEAAESQRASKQRHQLFDSGSIQIQPVSAPFPPWDGNRSVLSIIHRPTLTEFAFYVNVFWTPQ